MNKGTVSCNILYLFGTSPNTRSTCILTWANFRVRSTSKIDNWVLPLVKAGIFSDNMPLDRD